MRVLHLNSKDIHGGAGRATYRLHQTLQQKIESTMLVREKHSEDTDVQQIGSILPTRVSKLRRAVDSLPVRRHFNRSQNSFSPCVVPDRVIERIDDIDPDIVHLHWVGGGYMQIESIGEIQRPTVWTLHDMWGFTGGCHYSGNCGKYENNCGSCPVLNSGTETDLSRKVWKRKRDFWQKFDPKIVTPSKWLGDCAGSSSLFENTDVRVIPNAVPTDRYHPESRRRAKDILDINSDKYIFIYGAMDATDNPRKGYKYIQQMMERIPRSYSDEIEFIVFGSSKDTVSKIHGIPVRHFEYIPEANLPALYSVADAMIVPSKQDNLPNTVLESLACGTPCIAFDVGGIPDMIQHRETGYLAEPYNPDGLVEGIEWIIAHDDSDSILSRCRNTVLENFSPEVVREQYVELYSDVLQQK